MTSLRMHKETLSFLAGFLLYAPLFAGAAGPIAVLENPTPDIWFISDFIVTLFDLIVYIVTPLIAVFLMYAGFLFVSAKGNETQITKAKMVLLWTCVGAAVILGAKAFAIAIEGTIDSLR